MNTTEPTDRTDERAADGTPMDRPADPTSSDTPSTTSPSVDGNPTGEAPAPPVPPAGLPLPPTTPVAAEVAGARSPFVVRHAVGIVRAIAVMIAVVALLILWQEEAGGQTAGSPRPSDQVAEAEEKKHFDLEKLEKYVAERETATPPDAPTTATTGTVERILSPANEEGERVPMASTGAGAAIDVPPVRGPATADAAAEKVRALGLGEGAAAPPITDVPIADLGWHDGFELALALQREFAELQPIELPALKTALYQQLLEFSRLAGRSDNPLERMTALAELLTDGMRIIVSEESTIDTLLPAHVLSERRASATGWCVLALALADRTRDLVLDPVICAGELALRYENGAHRYVLSPLSPDRVLTDREFSERVSGPGGSAEIRPLARPEFWGHVIAEGGIDRLAHGAWARGMHLIEQGLALDPRQPRARVAQARGHLERREEARALECLDAAVVLDPTDRAARRARVELLLELGRTDAAADDLAFLARDLSDPLDTVRYARWWLGKREFRRAHATLAPVLAQVSAESEAGRTARALETEIAAAPWIAILRDGNDDRARLRAARRLGSFTTPQARDALVAALEDRNGHIANVALAVLRTSTGRTDLPRDPAAWRRALAEESTGMTGGDSR